MDGLNNIKIRIKMNNCEDSWAILQQHQQRFVPKSNKKQKANKTEQTKKKMVKIKQYLTEFLGINRSVSGRTLWRFWSVCCHHRSSSTKPSHLTSPKTDDNNEPSTPTEWKDCKRTFKSKFIYEMFRTRKWQTFAPQCPTTIGKQQVICPPFHRPHWKKPIHSHSNCAHF